MDERPPRRLLFRAHPVADRTALHEEDRVVSILAHRRRRKPQHIARPRPPHDRLEADGRDGMALVDHHVPVVGDEGIHIALPHQALEQRDIDPPGEGFASAAPASDRRLRDPEKRREAGHPLFLKRTPVDQDERIHPALRDQPRRQHRLAEGRRRRQDAGVVLEHRLRRRPLFRPKLAGERDIERRARIALVPHLQPDAGRPEQCLDLFPAPPRQRDGITRELGAGDDARDAEGVHPHRLGLVEFRILECGQPHQAVQQRSGQRLAFDRDDVAQAGNH